MANISKVDLLNSENADVLVDIVVDPKTTEHLRVKTLNKLLEGRENQNFFQTMFEENMSFGACPNCKHENHWLIPENDLNVMGWVTYEKDPRVFKNTDAKSCTDYSEACAKKKTSF